MEIITQILIDAIEGRLGEPEQTALLEQLHTLPSSEVLHVTRRAGINVTGDGQIIGDNNVNIVVKDARSDIFRHAVSSKMRVERNRKPIRWKQEGLWVRRSMILAAGLAVLALIVILKSVSPIPQATILPITPQSIDATSATDNPSSANALKLERISLPAPSTNIKHIQPPTRPSRKSSPINREEAIRNGLHTPAKVDDNDPGE
jgi:hypothetical protein